MQISSGLQFQCFVNDADKAHEGICDEFWRKILNSYVLSWPVAATLTSKKGLTSGGQVQEGSGRVQKEGSGGGKQGQSLLW